MEDNLQVSCKNCMLDPIPTWLIKESRSELLPVMTNIINSPHRSNQVPTSMKSAIVTPLLKKSTLDPDILKNYRPVSNLSYISKLLERVVAGRLTDYMAENNLHEHLQSAYKPGHSTETALVKVQNDILTSIDQHGVVLLVILDLSAAFDTIDHDILFSRMEKTELIRKLKRVQNNAARVVTLTKKHDHITPVLKELHWLPVRQRIEFKILLLAYKYLHGTAPSYLREMLKEYVPPRALRSTSKNLLCEPRTNMKTYGDRSFSACAPKLWNQLPNNILAAGSVAIF